MKPKEKELREGIKKYEEMMKKLEINSETTQIQINELFNDIKTKLDAKQQELLNQFNETERSKKKELELQIEELKFGIESIIGSCQIIENSISLSNNNNNNNKNDNLRLLSMKSLYHSRLDCLSKLKWKTEPNPITFAEISICEKEEQSIYSNISNLGFIKFNEISGERSLISRIEKQRIYENEEYWFQIISYSKEGNEMKKGGYGKSFKIQIEEEEEEEEEEESNNGKYEWKIIDLENGSYQVKMKFKEEGRYSIFVQYDGINIPFSCFQIQVYPKVENRNYNEINEPKLTFGSEGKENEQFDFSYGITIDSKGNILVGDFEKHRIQIFDSDGKFISQFGSYGKENGQFNYPTLITINSKGNIIVSDQGNHRIQIFDSEGKFILTFGSKGKGNGQFDNPEGICVDFNDNIYVCDRDNHRIQIFNSNGNFISKFGSKGKGNGQLDEPVGITINSNGHIIVSDNFNNRIQIFNSKGEFISTFGSKGNGKGKGKGKGNDGLFRSPDGICVDLNDNIFVCDYYNDRIQMFNPEGKYITQFKVKHPKDITIDLKTQNIIVCEDDRVSIF